MSPASSPQTTLSSSLTKNSRNGSPLRNNTSSSLVNGRNMIRATIILFGFTALFQRLYVRKGIFAMETIILNNEKQLEDADAISSSLSSLPSPSSSNNNNNNNNNNDDDNSKPKLFLHIGPQKTGSSTLQTTWDIIRPALGRDNFNYKHITPEAGDFNCQVGEWGDFRDCVASDQLVTLIEQTRDEGKNLLLSDENLDGRFVQALRDVINDEEWNVTVILVYRRIHEWLVSWYNQINKTTNMNSQGKILLDDKGIPYREDHKYWPEEGGRHVPGFIEWYKDFVRHWKPEDLVKQHRSIKFFEAYKDHFQNIVVYDMHKENGDLVVDFMCDIIHATDSCDRLRNHDVELPKTVNQSVNLDHDILGVYAHEQGLIKNTLPRKDVSAAITKYMKQHPGKQLPRKCDIEVTDQIQNWLIDSEKIMFSDIWTSERERLLRELIQSYVTKGLLCDVDVETAISDDDELTRFFQSLTEANLKQYLDSTDGIISHGGISSADRRPTKQLRG